MKRNFQNVSGQKETIHFREKFQSVSTKYSDVYIIREICSLFPHFFFFLFYKYRVDTYIFLLEALHTLTPAVCIKLSQTE